MLNCLNSVTTGLLAVSFYLVVVATLSLRFKRKVTFYN